MTRQVPAKPAKPRPPSPWDDFAPPPLSVPAKAEFDRLVKVLRANGGIHRTDPQLVVTAATVTGLLAQANEAIANEGLTITPPNGCTYAHPLLGQIGSLALKGKGLYRDLGLTLHSFHMLPRSNDMARNEPTDDEG